MDYKDIQNYLGGNDEMFHMELRPGISFPYDSYDDNESVEMFLRKFSVDGAVEVEESDENNVEEMADESEEEMQEIEPDEEKPEEKIEPTEEMQEIEPETEPEEEMQEIEPEIEPEEKIEPEKSEEKIEPEKAEPKTKLKKTSSANGLLLVNELVKKYKESHHINK